MMVFAGEAFQWIRRSLRADDAHLQSHQRNGLTDVPAGTSRRVRQADAIWLWLSFRSWPLSHTAVRFQAVVRAARSKSVPVFSIVGMITASWRATATAARLKPIFSLSFSPQDRSALSARLRVRITVAVS